MSPSKRWTNASISTSATGRFWLGPHASFECEPPDNRAPLACPGASRNRPFDPHLQQELFFKNLITIKRGVSSIYVTGEILGQRQGFWSKTP